MGLGTQKGDVGRAYDSVAHQWQQKILNPTGYHFWSYGVFDRLIQPYADESRVILDIGCGTGDWLANQKKRDGERVLVGIDVSCEMAKRAKEMSDCIIVIGDAERQPFKDEVFDFLASRGDAITQAYDIITAFSEVYRLLKPGGRVCFEMSWGNIPFEGLCREDNETLYRKDTILTQRGVKIQSTKRYHLQGKNKCIAVEELGEEEFDQTKWPDAKLEQATHVEERHILVGEEHNIQRLITGANLVLEDILDTGILGWQISTKTLSQNEIKRITGQVGTALEEAIERTKHTNLENSHRVTVKAWKRS
jgi:ubiquinone/menaquinone biosynthesis C-methylase UbiE